MKPLTTPELFSIACAVWKEISQIWNENNTTIVERQLPHIECHCKLYVNNK